MDQNFWSVRVTPEDGKMIMATVAVFAPTKEEAERLAIEEIVAEETAVSAELAEHDGGEPFVFRSEHFAADAEEITHRIRVRLIEERA